MPAFAICLDGAMRRRFGSLRVTNAAIRPTDDHQPTGRRLRGTHLLISQTDLAQVKLNIARFAGERGYILRARHVEDRLTAPDAFQALMQQVTTEDIMTILVPSLHHFSAVGTPREINDRLQELIGGRIIPTGYTP